MKSDPMFETVAPLFDKLIATEGANLDPSRLNQQLDTLYSTAYGEAIRKRDPNGRTNTPPNYAFGAAAGGSPDAGNTTPGNGRKLSEEDRIYIETMRDSGYDDKKIAEMMKARG
jgi:hypothetical protein